MEAKNTIVLVRFGVTTLIHAKATALLPNIAFAHISTNASTMGKMPIKILAIV